ncbi:MAG: hypothetical protein J0M20_05620 [Burkholderiales bacterium]|nr:hypothetical protein [Burkholderiales bacterium]
MRRLFWVGPRQARFWGMLGLCAGLGGAAIAAGQRASVAELDASTGAVCNNGGAATFQYRLSTHDGTGPVDFRKKWLVVLSGGGFCNSYETCRARWLEGSGSNTSLPLDDDGGPGNHFNMVPTPLTGGRDFDGRGILDYDGEPAPKSRRIIGRFDNPFRGPAKPSDGFNRIWIPYCSSDLWQGLGAAVPVQPGHFPRMPFDPRHGELTELRFAGALIVDEVIRTILRGRIGDTDLSQYIPDAVHGEIVLAGSSAGGNGVTRNLDAVAALVQQQRPGVKVYGVADAFSQVGALPDRKVLQRDPTSNARFYGHGDITAVRTDHGCDATIPRCHATNSLVARDEISTPYMLVQQAYDLVVHGDLLKDPDWLSERYVRWATTRHAPEVGLANGNPAALWIPNFETGWHQLMTDSRRFFVSPTLPDPMWVDQNGQPYPGDPRLGNDYRRSTLNAARAIGNFRRCVIGEWGSSASYADCIIRDASAPEGMDGLSRVVNTTAKR